MLEQPSRVGPAKDLGNTATTFRHFKRKIESATSMAEIEEAERGEEFLRFCQSAQNTGFCETIKFAR